MVLSVRLRGGVEPPRIEAEGLITDESNAIGSANMVARMAAVIWVIVGSMTLIIV